MTMEENLKTQSWLPSAMIKAHIKSSLHPRHHNRMEQWNERIGLFKRWLMSCYTTKRCPSHSGEKQLTLLAIHSTGCTLDLTPRKLLMNSREERRLLSNTSRYLVVTVIFCMIGRTKKSLMPRATKDTFWDILPLVEHTDYTI